MSAVSGTTLGGMRVLDFPHAWAGPFATQLLANYSAEVINASGLLGDRAPSSRNSFLPSPLDPPHRDAPSSQPSSADFR
jgi:crotonobetainyl-CoA:carnitine CoA-transferase CaiB-like acyl-CoA transferase